MAGHGRISFQLYDNNGDSNILNGLFYDGIKQDSYEQLADNYAIAVLLAHELTHVVQFERDGPSWYYTEYSFNYLINLFNPFTYFGKDAGPYMRIGYEIEARKYAKAVFQECRNLFEKP